MRRLRPGQRSGAQAGVGNALLRGGLGPSAQLVMLSGREDAASVTIDVNGGWRLGLGLVSPLSLPLDQPCAPAQTGVDAVHAVYVVTEAGHDLVARMRAQQALVGRPWPTVAEAVDAGR